MSYLGISCGFHDAAISLLDDSGDILFASHAERFSKKKNDPDLCPGLLTELVTIPNSKAHTVCYYERPWNKQLRQLYSGQGIDWDKLTTRQILKKQMGFWWPAYKNCKIKTYNHHLSHAAGGFQTSPFDEATVVVIDAIGEFDTCTIWSANYDKEGKAQYKLLWRRMYPHSIGLFYSAMTKRAGLKPLEEEYILMGMAAYGLTHYQMLADFLSNPEEIRFKYNCHLGVDNYEPEISNENIAASAQFIMNVLLWEVLKRAEDFHNSNNLVYTGGCALNCVSNEKAGTYFENTWVMPNPGDAGSSLGAAALAYGKKINFEGPYLGYDIPGDYPVNNLLDELVNNKIVGVANGKAEFGPRALGNRSLLADPRGHEIKDLVNKIKRRQNFRPFAPVILEEYTHEYFEMPRSWEKSPYMQVTAVCLHPKKFPAIIHHDGTSRVQTVAPDCKSGIRQLLEKWFVITGCPMLLNTSLNIRGEPMVNDKLDAKRFEELYGVKVFI